MSEAEAAYRTLVAQSDAAARAGDFQGAGRMLATAAGLAMDAGADASGPYQLAGEYFRRADRPLDAANCLHLSLAVPADEAARGPARVMLAGVLTSTLAFDAAAQQCAQVQGPALPAALDSACSIALAQGRRSVFDANLARLKRLKQPGAAMAARLRQAIAARLDGRLGDADRLLVALQGDLADSPAGMGTLHAERAEVACLRGDPVALDHWADAMEAFGHAGRRSLVMQARLGAVRAQQDLGLTAMGGLLGTMLGWAEQQELRLLALDLRRQIARVQRDARGLQRAVAACRDAGLAYRAGRTAIWHAELLQPAARLLVLQDAIADLEGDLPGQLLARAAHAEALAAVSPDGGRNAAAQVVDKARQIGMEHVRQRLEALL